MYDDAIPAKSDIKISKRDTYGAELEGALLVLTGVDAKGDAVTFDASQFEQGKDAELKDSTSDKLAYISGSEPSYVKNELR